ncbi:uncharacterized protein BJ212DRAFT_1477097 [Suillus subaureus]|uniref:Uncharacterized protein n=1 Tax=Suillus subaureus TaxID=48587 RepID=A0A9P7EIF0_9AGAM|nr:uncharacterized protein BJ212DRAFT_1477097 [Suillus subaureus]KAG1822679.1 hypothetical protein BJ212DRAFT_1477097 [Suillus subaureus]
MVRTSASCKVGPARKAPPPHKVSPAHITKTNHKFSKLPDTLPIAEGSVEDGSPEPSPTNKDSGALADDNTVVDSTVDGPILFKKRKTISSAACDSDNQSDCNYNDEEKSQLGSDNDDADKSPVPPGTQPQQADKDHVSPAPPARQAKGKGKQLPPPADDEEQHNNQHQADLDDGQQQVDLDENSEAIDKAVALGDKTVAEVEKIAKEYGKSVRTILIQAGLAVKTTCADNSWNMYQAWYKTKHPKSSDTPKFNPELACEKGEGTHDCNHCVAPIMMLKKFEGAGIPHEAKNIPWKTMLNSLYLHQAQVIDWPAGVPPVGSDFVFKDLKTDELKALVGPYLKRCMGSDYNVELARVEHPELKKKRKDKLSGVKVPETELMFIPWLDESKDLMSNEDSTMLNIPLITDTDVLRFQTLLVSPPRNSPTPQPSSPLVWSPSPPCRDHHKVMPLPCPIPTKVPPHQPSLQKGVVMHTLNPQLMSRITHPAPGTPVKSHKVAEVPLVQKCQRDESDGEDHKVGRWMMSSATHHYSHGHQQQHHLQHHPTQQPCHCSPSPPIRHSHHHGYAHSRSPVRHQYAYTQESAPVAGPSRRATKAWVSPMEDEEEVEVEDGGYDHDYFEDYE